MSSNAAVRKLKTAIIGCGKRADQHVKAAREAGVLDVVCACDAVTGLAQQKAGAWGCQAADYRGIVADKSIEAAIIVTNVGAHIPIAMELLRAGKHIIVEKPLGDDVRAGRELVALGERSGLVAYVSYQMRFRKQAIALKEAADKMRPVQILYERQRGMTQPQFLNPSPFCGVFDVAAHDFDFVSWLMGAAPLAVTAVFQRNTWTHTTGAVETLSALIDFGDGRSATVFTSFGGAQIENRLDLIGVDGYLSVGHKKGDFGVYRGAEGSDSVKSTFELPAFDWAIPDPQLQTAFAREVRGEGRSHAARLTDGLNSLLITMGCVRSVVKQCRVELASL